jgi:hypothetical protein
MNTSESTNSKLSQIQTPRFSSMRQDANPGLAAHLLQEIYSMVIAWQKELQHIAHRTEEITASGPVLAAWLEARSFKPGNYGEAIPTPYTTVDVANLREVDPNVGYRLCGLDEKGQLWTRTCPLPEILGVSMAIARYQQLKELNSRQQTIEARIRQILEDLVHLRMELED